MNKLNKNKSIFYPIVFDPFFKQNSFYKYKIKVTQEEINQIIIIIKNKKFKKDLQSNTYINNLNILNFPLLKNIKTQIIKILDEYNLYLTNNWAQFYNKNDSHPIHTHDNSFLSGILYLTNKGSPTIFYDRSFCPYENEVEKNILILFPSWIPHEVKPLKNNEERLVISFNTNIKL